ncbi:hypothetical protein WJX77_011820 [Trebouxia sp. C0004]
MATLTLAGIADLVAQAQCLQVRILHLGSLLPRFLTSSDGKHRFSPVLFDFRYFIDSATAEARIESSRHLQSLDEEMGGGYGTFLAKLWDLYARAVQLQQQVLSHIKHLTQASQAQQPASLQLVALLGSVLLLLDICVPGTARERSIVTHIRLHTGSQIVSRQAAAIVRLFAATGFEESVAKVPTGYPEQYLARCKLPKSAVQSLITQFLALPDVAPSAAASQLYIALYFVPEGLHGDSDLMKAAVSKSFRQSWVITWAPGHLADVSLQWQRYRAARNALGAVLTASKAKDIAAACKGKMKESQKTLNEVIQGQVDKGVRSAEKLPGLLACIHSNNVVLRWLLLHMAGHPQSKLSAAVAKQSIDKDAVIRLLLDSAYLESWTKSVTTDVLAKQWRSHCCSIAAKLDAAAAASAASGPSQRHSSSHQPAYEDAEEQTQQLSQSVCKAELKAVAEQVRTLQAGDSSGVQQLQLALERIQSSSSSSVHDAHLPDPRPQPHGTAAVLSSFSSPGHSPHRHELQAESPGHEGQASSSSPQNPFAEPTGSSHSFQPAADPWNPWAEPSHQQSASSPHYWPGSSDSDWDEQHQYDDQTRVHPSAQDHSKAPHPDHHEEDEQATSDPRAVSIEGYSPKQDPYSSAERDDPGHDQNPRVASAMAEAQHGVDQLAGLAASHAELQETLARQADLGYAWGLIGGYTQQLQQQIRTDPKAMPKVSALLFKLRSVMIPSLHSLSALKVDDADAAAAEVVSHFTRGLLHLAQSVLKVVPFIFFKVFDGIVALHEGHDLILPDRLQKPEVSKYAHLQERAEMAELAQTAAAYSRNLRAFDSDAVAPQKYDAMATLKLDVSQGIAARIARACAQTLTFTQPAASLLVQVPPQAGLLAGVAGGLAGSSGELVNRNELSAQLAQLTQELNTLKSSFQTMQDFSQLPLVFIWQQQLRSVMQQALSQELSSLPESVQAESHEGVLPNPASLSSRLNSQLVNVYADMREASQGHRDESDAPRNSTAAAAATAAVHCHADAAATETELGNLTQPLCQELPNPHASQGLHTLPQQATPAQPSGQTIANSLPQQASTARLPQQADPAHSSAQTLSASMHSARVPSGRTPQKMMYSGLPKHAVPAQPTFLRMCLAELLRLTNPTQSQFQPLLCGWYTAEGGEVMGLRGFRGLRQALGLTGVRCLDRLLQMRINDAMRRLSAILMLAKHDVDLSVLDARNSARSSHVIMPDPAAFKEAVKSGGKLWPIMSYYLAALGQASLIRQRLASDLRISERLLTAGKANSRETDSAPVHSNRQGQLDCKQADQETVSRQDNHEQLLQQQLSEQLTEQEQVETSDDPSDQGPAQNGEALLSQGSDNTQLGISDAEIPQLSGQIDCPEPSQGSESQPGVLMLLCVLSLMSRCSFHGRLGILQRHRSSQGSSDLYAVMQGLVVWLEAQDLHQYQAVLQTANQYISAYTQVATSATALSVQAAGIQIGLPAEIGRLLAFLQQVNTATEAGRSLLKRFLPPFLLDNWQCLVLSEKGL